MSTATTKKSFTINAKKTLSRIFLSCSFLAFIPFFLFGVSVWSWMWRAVGLREGEVCARSYHAVSKGTFWDRGEWHHYVDFAVDAANPNIYSWRVAHAPMPSSVYHRFIAENIVRVTYRWPSNWYDPFSLNSWELCLLEK